MSYFLIFGFVLIGVFGGAVLLLTFLPSKVVGRVEKKVLEAGPKENDGTP